MQKKHQHCLIPKKQLFNSGMFPVEAQDEPINLMYEFQHQKKIREQELAVTKLSPHPACFTGEVTRRHWPQTISADVVGGQLQCLQEEKRLAAVPHAYAKDSEEPW